MKKIKKLIGIMAVVGLLFPTTVNASQMDDSYYRQKAEAQIVKCWDLENGGLLPTADFYFVDIAEANINKIQWVELRKDLTDITHAIRVELDKQYATEKRQNATRATETSQTVTSSSYVGEFRITAYCGCERCCGKWSGSPTASGTNPVEGRTVATGSEFPFGTKLLIDGHVYTVEDRGVPNGCVDIYVDSHSHANQIGLYYTAVEVVE